MTGLTLRQAEAPYLLPPENDMEMIECPECEGRGYDIEDIQDGVVKCKECQGSGEIELTEKMRRDDADAHRAEWGDD